MFNVKSIVTASAVLTFISGASAGVALKRNEEPAQPSCVNFTPFTYSGCFSDPSTPRALLYSAPLNTQNMTIEICVAFCKGNNYKYAGLEYYGECFCGASVNGAQIAESNCNFPCTGNNAESCGGNDIISVYQDPTFNPVNPNVITDYMPLGCYSEGNNGRSLAWQQNQISASNMTVESCLSACKVGGYDFAGVEYGSQCFCGVVLGNGTLPIPSTTCNMPCSGNSLETCGGPSALNLYVATDLESNMPCNVVPPPVSSSTTSTTSTTSSSTSSSTSSTTTTTTSTTPSTTALSTTSTTSTTSTPSPTPTTISTSTTKPAPPPTTTTAPTTTTPSLCTSTVTIVPTPSCEYKCGNWCSNPLPSWNDQTSCQSAVGACSVQLASCFIGAGFPANLDCWKFSTWCQSVSQYCSNSCPWGGCSKSGCYSKNPPTGYSPPPPSYSTTVYPCGGSPTTTSKTTSSTLVPVPTASNICTQPNNPGKGYTSGSPVGNIALPCLTCNNLLSDYQSGNWFKLYTSPVSGNCPSYSPSGGKNPQQGCKDACDSQYNSCKNVYAQGCQNNFGFFGFGKGDTYWTAMTKCQAQWSDCYAQNAWVNPGSRCNSWNGGWF